MKNFDRRHCANSEMEDHRASRLTGRIYQIERQTFFIMPILRN